jgi:hypothetical protein
MDIARATHSLPCVGVSIDDLEPLPQGDLARESFLCRLRALLHTQPLHQLELRKGMRGGGPEKFETYDLLALQLAAIDYIADHQNPMRGVAVEEVEDENRTA